MHLPFLRVLWLSSVLLLVAAAGARAQQGDRVEPRIVTLPLVIGGQRTDVTAHLYKPDGAGPFPLVIYSHGRAGT